MTTTTNSLAGRLAREFGVGVATIYRDAKFAENIDHIAHAVGVCPNDVLGHRLPRRDLDRIVNLNPDAIRRIFHELAGGERWTTIKARCTDNYHGDSGHADVDELVGVVGRAIKRYRDRHPDLTERQIERAMGMVTVEGGAG